MASESTKLKDLLRKVRSALALPKGKAPKIQLNEQQLSSPRVRQAYQQGQALADTARRKGTLRSIASETLYSEIPQVLRRAPQIVPRINAADYLASKVQTTPGKIATQIAVGIPQELLNVPRDVITGSLATGANIADKRAGKKVKATKAVADAAEIARGLSAAYAPGANANLLRNIFKNPAAGKILTSGILNAGLASSYAVSDAAVQGRDKELGEQLGDAAISGLIAAPIGFTLGTATAALPYVGGRVARVFRRGARNSADDVAKQIEKEVGEIGPSVVQFVDQNTGRLTFRVIPKRAFRSVVRLIDGDRVGNPGIAGRAVKGVVPHITAKTPAQLIKKGFDYAGTFTTRDAQRLVRQLPKEATPTFGAIAGIERDEQGGISFNPEKAAVGVALLAGGQRIPKSVIAKVEELPKSVLALAKKSRTVNEFKDALLENPAFGQSIAEARLRIRDIFAVVNSKTRNAVPAARDGATVVVRQAQQRIRPAARVVGERITRVRNLAEGKVTTASPVITKARQAALSKVSSKASQRVSPGTGAQPKVGNQLIQLEPLASQSSRETIEAALSQNKSITPQEKVNMLDMLRTPSKVLEKIGLGDEAEALRLSEMAYQLELPKHMEQIADWAQRAPGKDANVRIFQWLDGEDAVPLAPNELQVAQEIREYLSKWADRLGLPEDKRIAKYITRLFDPDFAQKEFDPEIARLITDKIPGSVYDPYLQRRLGAEGYIQDTWKALEVYAKRGVRKANMDPALLAIKDKAKTFDVSAYKYVQRLLERVNLRPTEIDTLIDNAIKASPIGYKFGQRPTATITRFIRRMVYRATLGGNISSALRNITQGVNTYSVLGEKWFGIGYTKLTMMGREGLEELRSMGVLESKFVQDRSASAIKKISEKGDDVLFSGFQAAEVINRGAAYFGAKAKYLAEGMDADQAALKAADVARQTQFKFGAVDTPPILQADIAKFVAQFQSFNVKQAEFLAQLAKDREYLGLVRYGIGSLVATYTIGRLLGMDPKDFVPFSEAITEGKLSSTRIGQTPFIQTAGGAYRAVIGAPDTFGNEPTGGVIERLLQNRDFTRGVVATFVPAGVQIKKTLGGLIATLENGVYDNQGRIKIPLAQDQLSVLNSVVFGPYASKQAQIYFNEDLSPLGKEDTLNWFNLVKEGNDPVAAWAALYQRRIEEGLPKKIEALKKEGKEGEVEKLIEEAGKLYWLLDGLKVPMDEAQAATPDENTNTQNQLLPTPLPPPVTASVRVSGGSKRGKKVKTPKFTAPKIRVTPRDTRRGTIRVQAPQVVPSNSAASTSDLMKQLGL